MRNKDINSIAYIFKEMDPSEEVEFERNLKNNDNLLIEVESFKKVNGRLQSLPSFNPPDNVVKSVYRLAASKSVKPKSKWQYPFYYSVAAMILVGFTAGVFLIDSGETGGDSENASLGNQIFHLNNPPALSDPSEGTSSRVKVSPWVDNDEIIRFSDRIRHTETSSIDSVFKNSYQKLTPVTNPLQSGQYQRNFHLTGSRP